MNYLIIVFLSLAIAADATIDNILVSALPNIERNQIEIKELKGGLSGTSLYKIQSPDKSYVLRLHLSDELNPQDSLELFSFLEASKKGISPTIYYVSPNQKAVLMEFINQPTICLESAKASENIIKIAYVLKETHQITGHPSLGESLLSKAQRCNKKVLSDGLAPKNELTHALEIIEKAKSELSCFKFIKVNVHGDLNPRNIFIVDEKILLIDWAETTFEDPFYDLAYLSLKLDYGKDEDNLLLSCYLNRETTDDEIKRFSLHKKILYAFWSLTNLYLADVELKKHPEQQVDKNVPLKTWGYYQKVCADCNEELTAQYFYELSRLCYRSANSR